ncbi:MAG: type II secretion system F family protein, partial [Candidatus Parvarchaeota archaeon]
AIFFGLYILHFSRSVYTGLTSSLVIGISIGLLIGGFGYYLDEMRAGSFHVARPKIEFVKETKRNKHLDRIAVYLAKRSPEDILKAGISTTPHAFYYRWVAYSIWAFIICIPASFISSFLLKNPIPLLMLAAPPFFIFALPAISLSSSASDRKRAVDDELPFFALYMSILSDAGVSLYDSMKRLINRNVFRFIERDAVYLRRAVEFLGQDQLSAVDIIARSHPSKSMRDLLYGYSSELRSGGDIAGYFSSRAEQLLRWLEFRFSKYGESVSDLGETMVAIFFILPTLVLTSSFLSPAASIALVWLMSALQFAFYISAILAMIAAVASYLRGSTVFAEAKTAAVSEISNKPGPQDPTKARLQIESVSPLNETKHDQDESASDSENLQTNQ